MGLFESVSKAISNIPADLTSALAAEFFPEALAGFLCQYFDNMSAKQFYHEVKKTEGKSILDYLDNGAKARLMAMVPENLDWLNLEWLIKAIAEEHPAILSLIVSSPWVASEVNRQIEEFKHQCQKFRK